MDDPDRPPADLPAEAAAPPPPEPVPPRRHTVREFLFQLSTIAAGILLALGVDGLVALSKDRALVREARAAIADEISSNLRDLEGTLPALDTHYRNLTQGLRFADDLLQRGSTDVAELNFPLSIPSLNRASWQTAERTGALSLMSYNEVKDYSELYELQELVVSSQRIRLGRISDLSAIVYAGEGGDPLKARRPDLEVFRTRLLDEIGALRVHKTLVDQLVGGYREALQRVPGSTDR